MYKYSFVLLIALIVSTCAIPHHTSDHAHHCHAGQGKDLLHVEVGHSAKLPGKCEQVTCEEGFKLSTKTCPVYKLKEGCTTTEPDLDKDYPDCCPQVTCDEKH